MAIKLITSWKVLFQYAHEVGQARLLYRDFPTEENKLKFEEAEVQHDHYRDMCLEADEMIGLEGLL